MSIFLLVRERDFLVERQRESFGSNFAVRFVSLFVVFAVYITGKKPEELLEKKRRRGGK